VVLSCFKLVASTGPVPLYYDSNVLGALPDLVMPLGLSYLTFELIHFVVDRGRGRFGTVSLAELAAFAFYLPCRVAGPIKRFGDFRQSMYEARPSTRAIYRGSLRILLGLAKKVVLADLIGYT